MLILFFLYKYEFRDLSLYMYVGEACCLNFRFSLIYFYILEAEAEYTESDIFVDTSISEFRLLIKKTHFNGLLSRFRKLGKICTTTTWFYLSLLAHEDEIIMLFTKFNFCSSQLSMKVRHVCIFWMVPAYLNENFQTY